VADVTRSRLTALAVAVALVLPGCGMTDELSDPSPVSRPTTSTPSAGGAPGDLLPGASATETGGSSAESPTTESRTTQSPTTESPTTESPTTDAPSTGAPPTQSPPPAPEPELGAPGIPACDVMDLPATALPVIEDIEAGGPYDYPRNDGVRFGNREGILPDEDRDYYREFTVETPGLDHRGPRRIVTGGFEETDPDHWYFTDDHYESFCEFDPDLST